MTTDEVVVTASIIDSALLLDGKQAFCITTGDSAVLKIQPGNQVQWYKNNNPITGANQPNYKVTQSGTYFALLTNNDGCSISTRSETITVETPKIALRYPLQYAVINNPVELQARQIGETVLWKPSIYLDEATNFTPNFNAPVLLEQTYTIEIKTALGCVTVDTQVVKTIKEVKMYVPTAFTPNNDGRNDFLRPVLIGIRELKYFRIYNRWGELIYDLRSDERGWDGRLGGIPQTTGVYVWMVYGVGHQVVLFF
jgi:gliding motility-associated-like protein